MYLHSDCTKHLGHYLENIYAFGHRNPLGDVSPVTVNFHALSDTESICVTCEENWQVGLLVYG